MQSMQNMPENSAGLNKTATLSTGIESLLIDQHTFYRIFWLFFFEVAYWWHFSLLKCQDTGNSPTHHENRGSFQSAST